ncbi:hypothetical protein HRI96_00665 [Treponema parvum]|uniref:Uncharacterized protein n=1 Tax=Treponema parvum TaxID=138851 RepID=A0A975EXG5_9SPIR|nr:hypothetical protein [Treponema parvum]QTQ10834.1 hypothetical protein HRI96_00665 [Treponema parvum]
MAKLEVTKNDDGFFIRKGENYSLSVTATEIKFSEITGFLCFKETYESVIKIEDVLFFDYNAKFFGLLGYNFRGGNNDLFYFNKFIGLKKEIVLEIRQWLVDHGVKFATEDSEGKAFKPTGFHPLAKEFLAINDTHIAHHYNTKFRNRDSIIPYYKIDFFLITTACCCTKRLLLIGSLNFATEGSFSSGAIDQVRKELEAHSIKPSEGKVYYPNFFSGVKGRKKKTLILLEDKIVYMHTDKGKTVAQIVKTVTSYKCKPIFSLFKRVVYIEGFGETDMRTGTIPSYKIVFPGVFFFWWFCCGKIKVACKALRK